MYACLGEHDGELSFEPNQIITNGTYRIPATAPFSYTTFVCSEDLAGAGLAGGHAEREDRAHTGELRRDLALTERLAVENFHVVASRPL